MSRRYFVMIRKLRRTSLLMILLIGTGCLLPAVASPAAENQAEINIPADSIPGLRHFLDFVDPAKNVAFDADAVAGLLDFIEGPKNDAALYSASNLLGMPSAYYEFDVRRDLREIARYSFNPDIPAIATMPASVRLFDWTDDQGNRLPSPEVDHYLDALDAPVVLKGLQYLENTPDTTSGAYYAYQLHQTSLIFKYRQRKVLVTVSRQADVSTVGKKGYVLGSDDNWDYFYSGKSGLTLPALGWVRSYMYDSSGIVIYYEIDKDAPKVRCATFKWLRAGWSGINMVKNTHIHDGLKRFANAFIAVLENPALPPAGALAAGFGKIQGYSDDTLRSKMKIYSGILKGRYDGGKSVDRRRPSDLFANETYWSRMTREEMQSALVIEYMKSRLGKTRGSEIGDLFEFETVKR